MKEVKTAPLMQLFHTCVPVKVFLLFHFLLLYLVLLLYSIFIISFHLFLSLDYILITLLYLIPGNKDYHASTIPVRAARRTFL